jgi:hypothetical protein
MDLAYKLFKLYSFAFLTRSYESMTVSGVYLK